MDFVETSAKQDINVSQVFNRLTTNVLSTHMSQSQLVENKIPLQVDPPKKK